MGSWSCLHVNEKEIRISDGFGDIRAGRREALEKYSAGAAPIWRGHAPQNTIESESGTNRLAAKHSRCRNPRYDNEA